MTKSRGSHLRLYSIVLVFGTKNIGTETREEFMWVCELLNARGRWRPFPPPFF